MSVVKKSLLIVSILILGFAFFSKSIFEPFKNTDTVIHKIGCRLFEFNTIYLEVADEIDINDIEIKVSDQTVFKNGKQEGKIGQHYGGNMLDIYHDGILIAQVGHFKKNNWHVHDYELNISDENGLTVGFKIIGPDGDSDSFQKRLYYNQYGTLVHIDFINQAGEIYHSEKRMP